MKYILVLIPTLFLTACSFSIKNEDIMAAEVMCEKHSGLNTIQIQYSKITHIKCNDNLSIPLLIEENEKIYTKFLEKIKTQKDTDTNE